MRDEVVEDHQFAHSPLRLLARLMHFGRLELSTMQGVKMHGDRMVVSVRACKYGCCDGCLTCVSIRYEYVYMFCVNASFTRESVHVCTRLCT